MSAESSPAAAPAPAPAPKAKQSKAKAPLDVGGFPPAFRSTKPPAGRPSAVDAAIREAEARDLTTTTEEV